MIDKKVFLAIKKEDAMRTARLLLIVMMITSFAAMAAPAADLKVIANPNVAADTISADELKDVFLQARSSLSDGTPVRPVLEKGGPTHEAFLREYLGKTDAALQTFYRSQVFTGKASMPKMVVSEAEVVAYVAKTKGAIGYVSSKASTAGVKTLAVR